MPYPRGKMWVGQVRSGNRRKQGLFSTKAEAQEFEVETRKVPPENWNVTRTGYSLGNLANDYLSYCRTKHSMDTYKEKVYLFRHLFMGGYLDPNDDYRILRPDTMRHYLQSQCNQRSGYAANKDRKNLLAFSSWVARYKGIFTDAVAKCEKFPEIRQGRYVPPEEDFWRTWEIAEGQDKCMLLAYLHLAARRRELFRLRWDDIDWLNHQIRLYTRKRKDGSMEADWIPLTDRLYAALEAHRTFVGGEWVFPAPDGGQYKYRRHLMKRLCAKAGVRHFGFHAIRHLSGSVLAEAGVPMIHIQAILRHKNLRTTERYLHRMQDIRGSLEKAFAKEG